MKTFENPILRTEFVNIYGEKMVLVMDSDFKFWFFHEDIVKDFEKINGIVKYVLNEEEILIIEQFLQTCQMFLKTKTFQRRLDLQGKEK